MLASRVLTEHASIDVIVLFIVLLTNTHLIYWAPVAYERKILQVTQDRSRSFEIIGHVYVLTSYPL